MKTARKNILTAIVLLLTLQVLKTNAAWGDYDASFGFGGVSVDSVTGYYPKVTELQPDGKILVTGYRTSVYGGNVFFLRRYLSNGSRDTAFGTNGEATGFDSGGFRSDYVGYNIVVLPNGNISVAGKANGFYAVWQVTANGSSDRNFGRNGLLILNQYPFDTHAPNLNIQGGKILLTIPKASAENLPIVLVRINANGTLDQTFGNVGESVTDLVGRNGLIQGYGTIIESNGKITIGGSKMGNTFIYGLDRILANGKPDLTFLPADTPGCCVGIPGLVKLNDGKYEMWTNNSGITFYVLEFNSLGAYERNPFVGSSAYSGYCPNIFTKQSDGKILMSAFGSFHRLDLENGGQAVEQYGCENLDSITDKSRAAIYLDDRIVFTGRFNDSLMLVRLLPD